MNYGAFTKSFSYAYYANGLKQTFTAPDSTIYTYLYGLNNELQDIQIPSVGSVTIPAYTWNRPATVNYPGGVSRAYTYDALMRLESLTVLDPNSTSILDYSYTYDEVGNILTKNTGHGNYTYGYDAVSRLITADNPVLVDEAYTYDDVGNRLTDSSVSGSWSYNLNNELLGYADVEYEYDENGNLTQITVAGSVVWTYTYDAANRLVHVEDGTGTISADYYYDPFGRRLWKDIGGTRTYFFYSEEGLIAEYDENGVEIRSYGYQPDSTWTTDPLWLKEGGTYYWYQNDHLGTPQKLTAQDGTVVWSAQYSAFGEATIDIETVINNLRFPGQFYDEETGLLYNFQRYYDPKIGRYLRTDPLTIVGGTINWYEYARNNPISTTDASGLTPWTSQRTTKSVVEILKGVDLLYETYEYRFETENSAAAYEKDLKAATETYQCVFLEMNNADGRWGRGTERAHLKKIGEYKKSVILTFDDGPGLATSEILNILRTNNIPGVFFVLGSRVEKNSAEVQRMWNEGHSIEVHGWTHPEFPTLTQNEIYEQLHKTLVAIRKTVPYATPTRFRPPYGAGWVGTVDPKVVEGANRAGLILTGWFVDSEDWKDKPGIKFDFVDKQLNNYIKGGHLTKIDILMHVRQTTAKTLPQLIERLKGFGYEFTTY